MGAARDGSMGVLEVKGDIPVLDDNDDVERLPVGADGTVMVADSISPLGVKWEAQSVTASAFLPRTITVNLTVPTGKTALAHTTTIADGVNILVEDGAEMLAI